MGGSAPLNDASAHALTPEMTHLIDGTSLTAVSNPTRLNVRTKTEMGTDDNAN